MSWYDLDLSTKPYRTMQYHKDEVACVAFHTSYPLFASASADGTVHVFHGQVFQVCLLSWRHHMPHESWLVPLLVCGQVAPQAMTRPAWCAYLLQARGWPTCMRRWLIVQCSTV